MGKPPILRPDAHVRAIVCLAVKELSGSFEVLVVRLVRAPHRADRGSKVTKRKDFVDDFAGYVLSNAKSPPWRIGGARPLSGLPEPEVTHGGFRECRNDCNSSKTLTRG